MNLKEKTNIANIIETSKEIAMSEIAKIGALVFISLILFLLLLPRFFDNSALKAQLEQKINQATGANVIISGDVKVSILPPTIVAKDVLVQNFHKKIVNPQDAKQVYNLYAKKISIRLPLINFSKKIFSKITLQDAIVETYKDQNLSFERKNKFSEIATKIINETAGRAKDSGSGISAKLFSVAGFSESNLKMENLADIVIKNGDFIYYDASFSPREYEQIYASFSADQNFIDASGSFLSHEILSNFDLIIKLNSKSNKPSSKLEIKSLAAEIEIKGNFPSALNDDIFLSDFSGTIEGEISELKSFYQIYFGGKQSIIAQKLKIGSGKIQLNANIESHQGDIKFNNISLKSSAVDGSGFVDVNLYAPIPLVKVNLDLKNLDFDRFLSKEPIKIPDVAIVKQEENVKLNQEITDSNNVIPKNITPDIQLKNTLLISSDLTANKENNASETIKNFDLSVDIKIAAGRLFDGDVSDINLLATSNNKNEITVSSLIIKTPGTGILKAAGIIKHSSNLPSFVGKIEANGESLKEVFGWFKIETKNIKIEKLKEYNFHSDLEASLKNLHFSNLYASLNHNESELFGDVEIDNTGKNQVIYSRFNSEIFNLDNYYNYNSNNSYLYSGLLLKKLFWLNEINAENNIELSFTKLIYKGEELNNQSLKLRIGNGVFEIKDFKVKSDDSDISLDLALSITGSSPQFNLSISANNFSEKIIGGLNSYQGMLVDKFYNLASLEGFDGKITAQFGHLQNGNIIIDNFTFDGNLKDGEIDSAITGLVYGGKMIYRGLVGIKSNKSISGNLELQNVALNPLFSDLFAIKNISGIANISSSITSLADAKENFVKTLGLEAKISAVQVEVEGYGLTTLMQKMFYPQNYANDLRNPEAILFDPHSKTIFSQATGSLTSNVFNGGKFSLKTAAPAINGILSGTFDLVKSQVNSTFSAIFLSGTRKKIVPINVATNISGGFNSLKQETNLLQVRQYLGLEVPVSQIEKTQIIQPASPAAQSSSNQAQTN